MWLCPQELTTLPHELHPNGKCVIEKLGLYYGNTVWTHKLWTGEKISGESHSMHEFPTMKPLDMPKKADKAEAAPAKVKKEEVIDFSKVEIEPLFADQVDFDTFSKSDFRAVKIKACEAVKKSKKLLQFVLDDGTGEDRIILSGIHEYYEPEELVGKTAIAIVNLPPRKMMGIDSCGMLISAVHHENGEEKLHLLMVDPHIPAGAKLY